MLRSGLEVRLGDVDDLRLKLAIARRILAMLGPTATTAGYLDVSVPERPVVGTQQLSSRRYRLRVSDVEARVFRIDKGGDRPYPAGERRRSTAPASTTA